MPAQSPGLELGIPYEWQEIPVSYTHLDVYKRQDKHRLSLGGIYAPREGSQARPFKKPLALESFLGRHPEIEEIEICLNNDFAGRWAAEHLEKAYQGKYRMVKNLPEREGLDVYKRQGVDCSLEQRRNGGQEDSVPQLGAGDQGVMVGYACNETPEMLPLPVILAHRLTISLALARRYGLIHGLRPDGKAQVTVEYGEDGKPLRLDTVVVSAQHSPVLEHDELCWELTDKVLFPALQPLPPDEDTKILINPSGRFVLGGPEADTGLTGRKLMVDTYGSMVPHGGGAFSGKDPTKVDRSGAYMARYIAKNLVAAGLASRCQVTLAYAIGKAEPVMVQVDTFGTGLLQDDHRLAETAKLVFGLTPGEIIAQLDLLTPRYAQTAVYGHFGKPDLPWEKTDQAKLLREAVL